MPRPMIKQFEILQTRPEPEGTGVIYQASRRLMKGNTETTRTIKGYLLVLAGRDVDREVYEYLKKQGWVQ